MVWIEPVVNRDDMQNQNIALVRVAEIMIQENLRGIVFPFYVYGKEGCELLKLDITIK